MPLGRVRRYQASVRRAGDDKTSPAVFWAAWQGCEAGNWSRWCGALLGDEVAAVHDQVLPGDVGRARVGQPGHGGDLTG